MATCADELGLGGDESVVVQVENIESVMTDLMDEVELSRGRSDDIMSALDCGCSPILSSRTATAGLRVMPPCAHEQAYEQTSSMRNLELVSSHKAAKLFSKPVVAEATVCWVASPSRSWKWDVAKALSEFMTATLKSVPILRATLEALMVSPRKAATNEIRS